MTEHYADDEDRRAEVATRRLAKFVALYCFRETYLESLHGRKVPDSPAGDFSDVRVVTPTREIPWNEVARVTDPEMKRLMIEVVDRCYAVLEAGFDEKSGPLMMALLAELDVVPEWYDPKETNLDVMAALIRRSGRV